MIRHLLVLAAFLLPLACADRPCTTCGGQCVDIGTDPQNCGGCGDACADGVECDLGTVPAALKTFDLCDATSCGKGANCGHATGITLTIRPPDGFAAGVDFDTIRVAITSDGGPGTVGESFPIDATTTTPYRVNVLGIGGKAASLFVQTELWKDRSVRRSNKSGAIPVARGQVKSVDVAF